MYTAREVSAVLGLSAGRLRSYLRSGFVAPSRGDDGALRFSFQDLLVLRRAEGLVAERIAPRRVRHALRKLHERLPRDLTLASVRLAAEGSQIVVDDGQVRWHPESGQTVFDFDRSRDGQARGEQTDVASLGKRRAAAASVDVEAGLSAQDLYQRACAVEDRDSPGAQRLYRRALARRPDFADAHINLGRLLHEAGDVPAALLHYRAASRARPADATAAFNIGVALEDLGRPGEAASAYGQALSCDPTSPDAHYNMARLFEQLGKPEMALRHLLIYRRLTRRK